MRADGGGNCNCNFKPPRAFLSLSFCTPYRNCCVQLCVCVCVNKKKTSQFRHWLASLSVPCILSLSQCTHYLSTKMLQFRLFGSVVSGAYLPVPSHRDLHTSSSSIDMCVHKTGSAALRPFFDRLYPSASLLTTQVSLKSSVILSNTTVYSVDHYILPSVFA